jgi:hypothetical protein
MTLSMTRLVLVGTLAGSVAACGGGGSDGDSASAGSQREQVAGVAAIGAAISNRQVALKDATGAVLTTSTDASGEFTFDVSTLKAPFMLRVQQQDGTFLYSASVGNGVANINPLSNVILGKLSAAISGVGTDPNALFQGFATFGTSVTTARLDRATASVYEGLTPAFKAELANAGADFNPIYAPFQIGNVLDRTFDKLYVFYDPQSGEFQEKETIRIKSRAFGPLAPLTDVTKSAGKYKGEVTTASSQTLPVTAVIDNDGNLFMSFGQSYAVYGKVAMAAAAPASAPASAPVSGNWYALNAASPAAAASATSGSIDVQSNQQLKFTLNNAPSGLTSTQIALMKADVNSTYGNNLKGTAKQFRFAKLGPYSVGDGSKATFGSSASSSSMYFHDATISSVQNTACRASNSWSMDLSDLELSLYAVTLKEVISSVGGGTCAYEGTLDASGTAMFVDSGLLVFYADKDTASTNDAPHGFVAVKLFPRN